jgi:hypothetical protein
LRVGCFLAVAVGGLLPSAVARAEGPDAQVTADDVTLDARTQALSLRGHVDIVAPPFNMTSDALVVTRTPRGLIVEGDGRVAFCPCLGEPLAIGFRGATVAPPGDLFLTGPRLYLEGLPVLWLPYFWLRSAGRPGLLPPDIEYRGHDGLFLGDGFHLPWSTGDRDLGLDLRAGGYVEGGVAVDGTLRTPISTTQVRWDHLGSDGLSVDARGSTAMTGNGPASLSWDADLIRGARGVVATTDVEAAARVFDRAAAESAWRTGGWTLAAGAWAEGIRGDGLGTVDVAGPVMRARNSGSLGGSGTYDATLEGGTVTGAGLPALSYARADAGSLAATRWGPVGASLDLRGGADVVNDSSRDGYDAAAMARAAITLPVARELGSSAGNDPWRHVLEPRVEAAVLTAHSDDLLGEMPTPGGLQGTAWLTGFGLGTALGRWGARSGVELGGTVGLAGGVADETAAMTRWRVAASGPWYGVGAEGADVFGPAAGWGHALAARVRVGSLRSFNLALLVAGRDGVDPVVARLLTDAPIASSVGLLASDGWTGGARGAVPIGQFVTARGGVDGDLTTGRLVATRGSLDLHDHCGCVAVRLSASERIGRQGVDVWVSIDLAPKR